MDCPLAIAEDLKTQLKVYKLRSKVKIHDATALYDVIVSGVHDPWQGMIEKEDMEATTTAPQPKSDGISEQLALFEDPRSTSLGVRFIRTKGEPRVGRHVPWCSTGSWNYLRRQACNESLAVIFLSMVHSYFFYAVIPVR